MKKVWLGLLGLFAALAVFAGTSNYTSFAQFHDGSVPTWNQTAADGAVAIEKTLEVDGAVDLDSTLNVAGAVTLQSTLAPAGDVTLTGGAGALTFSGSASSIVVDDNDTTALLIGSTGLLNLITLDTGDSTETVIITGTTTVDAFHVDVGTSLFDEGVDMAVPAAALQTIRFCGNGPSNGTPGTPTYMGPVLLDDTEADLVFGGAGCDALDNEAEGTADAPWHSSFAFKPVAMACVGRCTGATAANDAIAFQLRDDTADVTGMTCTTAALGGDDTPAQCVVRDATPATVAAASAIAVEITMTDDACDGAGDDFECLLYVTF